MLPTQHCLDNIGLVRPRFGLVSHNLLGSEVCVKTVSDDNSKEEKVRKINKNGKGNFLSILKKSGLIQYLKRKE